MHAKHAAPAKDKDKKKKERIRKTMTRAIVELIPRAIRVRRERQRKKRNPLPQLL